MPFYENFAHAACCDRPVIASQRTMREQSNKGNAPVDCLLQGLAASRHLALTVVDVTDTARLLERRHLSGPTAGRILAEALCAGAIASANLDQPDERVCLRFEADGPVGGCTVDINAGGELRGFTNIKVLNDLDGDDAAPLAQAWGGHGRVSVVQSTSRRVSYSAVLRLDPPDVRVALAKYFNESLQRPAAVTLFAASKGGYVDKAIGVLAEKMPDATSEDFVPLLEAFDDRRVQALLAGNFDWQRLTALPGLEDLSVRSVRELKFGCACSRERVIGSLAALERAELEQIDREGQGQEANCHFCGKDYRITPEEIRELLRK